MYTNGEWKQGKRHTDTVYAADENTRIATCFSPNSEANARLIASAPLQNKALIWVAEWLGIREPDGEKPNRADVVRAVNEALAKARL